MRPRLSCAANSPLLPLIVARYTDSRGNRTGEICPQSVVRQSDLRGVINSEVLFALNFSISVGLFNIISGGAEPVDGTSPLHLHIPREMNGGLVPLDIWPRICL
jgi:hypothetical protein